MAKRWFASSLFALAALFANGQAARAQDGMQSFELTLSAPEDGAYRVGDRVRLRLKPTDGTEAPPSKLVILDGAEGASRLFNDEGLALIEDLESESYPQSLVALKPGKKTIPPFEVRTPEGKLLGLTSEQPIEVAAEAEAPPEEPYPAQGAATVSIHWMYFAMAGGVLLLIAIIVLLVLKWLAIRSARALSKLKFQRRLAPPDVEAFQALEKLESERLLEKGRHKEHYFRVSEILKRFLSRRFEIEALESTTSELLELLRAREVTSQMDRAVLASLMDRLDLVKFTDHVPALDDGALVIKEARGLVDRNRPPIESVVDHSKLAGPVSLSKGANK